MRKAPRLPLEALSPYLLEPPTQADVLSWPAVFGNDCPVEIEIGFGKGLFLLTSSQARPAMNFLGIEVFRKYQLYTATRLAKRQLHNVRLACADARVFLAAHVAPASVQAIHIYFPDPWWKKRHQKRRLFHPAFTATCERILQPDGWLHIVTDVEEYFRSTMETLAQQARLQQQTPSPDQDPRRDGDCLTNFERKYREEGRPIYGASFRKM